MGIIVGPNGAERHESTGYVALREVITDVTRQIEDLNWTSLSTDRQTHDLAYEDRKRMLQRIRLYRRRSPLAKQAANLLQHYTLGQGVSLKANNKALVARLVDEFWEDPVNAAVFTSHQSQKEALDALFTDGDLFIVLFPDAEAGTVHLGLLDAVNCDDIITDPDNARVAKWYRVRRPDSKYNFGSGTWESGATSDFVYYRDWRNTDDLGKGTPKKSMIADGLIYHVRINRRGKFGTSELETALDWLKSHKDFMEDRVSLNRAAAQIAWRKKRKGGASDIASEVARLQSTMVTNITRYESNPTPASASTLVENEGSTMEWMKTDTGAANAAADERTLRMMAGSGMGGIPNHYFGDEANANLATATAMELPLLKTYEDWQQIWADIIRDLIGFMLETAHEAGRIGDRDDTSKYAERVTAPAKVLAMPDVADKTGKGMSGGEAKPKPGPVAPDKPVAEAEGGTQIAVRDPTLQISMMPKTEPTDVLFGANDTKGQIDWFVDVDFPPIIQKDIEKVMNAIKTLYEFLPTGNAESQKLVAGMALQVMGQNNIEEVMDRLFPVDAAGDPLKPEVAPEDPSALMKALGSMLGNAATAPQLPGSQIAGLLAAPKNVTPPEEKAVAESLAEYRVRRVLRAARDASVALAALDGSADVAAVG
jgi:hypothetical protein